MRATLRFKLVAVVAVAAAAVVALTVSSGLSDHAIETQVDSIRETYLPKIRLRPALSGGFERLSHTVQNAVEAADADVLAGAVGERDALLRLATDARDAMTIGQLAMLSFAVNDYFDDAIAVSRKLIAGDGGEAVVGQVQQMQAKRTRVVGLIDQITAFDERALGSAFAATGAEEHRATFVRIVVGSIGLIAVLAISIWISRAVFASLGALRAGFERFGRNDFARPIVTTSDDELADVAAHANRMATELERLDQQRAHVEWLQRGVAGLGDQLRGELDPAEVASRTTTYLAHYLDAPVGALYHGASAGPFALLGRYGVDETVSPRFALGEGLVGQAATKTSPTVIDGGDAGLQLRSGVVECAVRSIMLAPIARGTTVTGVLELGGMRAWRAIDRELVVQASETVAIALEVAYSRAAAHELLERTQRQARELERVGATLEQKASELARASAYKSQFLANMSHELRTPLNAIIGFSEILYDGSVPVDDDTMHEYLGDILTSGKHLLQLINDVLDLAKVEAGKLEFHPEPLELRRVIGEVLAVLKTTTAKQQVHVTVDVAADAAQVVLDAGRLKQVLYNYLSNALKFTPARGKVAVRAFAIDGERIKLEVTDTGSGIAADQLGKLFADFHQTAEGAKRVDSTGLGLALTKRIVEAQGGEVGVTSKLGEGSTFFAVLPQRADARSSTLQVVRPLAPARNAPTILVVEDEPSDRARLTSVLTEAGYIVESVATGGAALERCERRTYDAITLDLLLPDLRGLEVLRRLRQSKNGGVPVIVVTVVAERGSVAGFAVHDVLAKPLSESALLTSLQRAGVDADGGRTVVLVVDDDVASLKVMSATLERLGYLAVCEPDPAKGLDAATEEPPAAIVLDLLMPGMTGFEFLDRLRATATGHSVPVIVWTSKDLTSAELARLRRSADAVVAKGHDGNARVVAELAAFLPPRRAREVPR